MKTTATRAGRAEGAAKNGLVIEPIRRNTKGCNGCGRCNFGCPHGAKMSVDIAYLPRAVAKGAQVWSDCLVDRVIVAAGRRGPDSAAVELGPAPALAKLEAKKPFKAGATPQVIAIAGTNFQPGMTARLVSPMDTDVTTFPAMALEQLSPTSFQLRTPLEAAGTYEISVRTPDGQRSNTLTLTVRK